MRIGLLSAWASRQGGGVFEAVVNHARLVRELGWTPVVFALDDAQAAADAGRFDGIEVHRMTVRGPRAIGYAPDMVCALTGAALDVLHIHGIWMYPSAAGAAWARVTGGPYVISPHGMLDPWITGRGRTKKALARIGYERRSWRRARHFHALTPAEAADIVRETGRDAVSVVPNGVTITGLPSAMPGNTITFLGRIHPKKNLDGLLDGWAEAGIDAAGWRLVIAGWGEPEHVAALETRLADLADPSIEFIGPVFGPDKTALLAGSRYLVLPTFSEGLPMAIIEAWAAGVPTVMSRGCNLDTGFDANAAIETGTDTASIAAALVRAAGISDAGHWAMAGAAVNLVRREFAHDVVRARWDAIYRELTEKTA